MEIGGHFVTTRLGLVKGIISVVGAQVKLDEIDRSPDPSS